MICTIFTINAMEVKDKCYLALLPRDICDRITSYLTFEDRESDDEFIDRTLKYGLISSEHQSLLETKNNFCDRERDSCCALPKTPPRAYSVDRSKIISLEGESYNKNQKVTIVNLQNKTKKEDQNLTQLLHDNIENITQIALSRTNSLCAFLHAKKFVSKTESRAISTIYEHYITVKNILSPETNPEFFLNKIVLSIRDAFPDDNSISIGFNKQGTKIIMHAKGNSLFENPIKATEDREMWHCIFLLTSPEEHEEKSKKTLETYLKGIGCCKKFK